MLKSLVVVLLACVLSAQTISTADHLILSTFYTDGGFGLYDYRGGGANEAMRIGYNLSPTLYVSQVTTEPQLYMGFESNFPNATYSNHPTTELYWRYGIAGTTTYVEPLFANVDRTTNKVLEVNTHGQSVTATDSNNVKFWQCNETQAGCTHYQTQTFATSPLFPAAGPIIGQELGVNRRKTLDSTQASPFDVLNITSRGEAAGWQGSIYMNVSYSNGTVLPALKAIANTDGTTTQVVVPSLAGTGNGFACVDANGKLFRSAVACN